MRIGFLALSLAAATAASSAQIPAPAAATAVKTSGYFSADYFQIRHPEGGWDRSFARGRGGVLFSGDWSANFGYALEFTLEAGGAASLEQAWAAVRASGAFEIRAGLYLVPFGRYNEARRPFQTKLIMDPFPVGVLYPPSWRDLGLVLTGRIGRLGYAGYLGNGLAEGESLADGQQFRDNNRSKAWGGRLSYILAENLEVGASYHQGMADDGDSRRRRTWGADLDWGSDAFRIVGEYAKAEIVNPGPFASGAAEGYFGMVSFRLGPLTPLASFQSLAYEDPFHGPGFRGPGGPGEGIVREEIRWAVGFVYPLHPSVLLKWEYDFPREKGAAVGRDVLRVQMAVRF
ncbi:MAG: porin [Candidatus Aminicenantes bacterium]|nr:porin [Candidatus Aminicenantes bacterium]